jgi:hypothetical protein
MLQALNILQGVPNAYFHFSKPLFLNNAVETPFNASLNKVAIITSLEYFL